MAKYNICFTQHWSYTVEADSEDEAYNLAYEEFDCDMHRPIATCFYDDCEIECVEENEDEDTDNV